MSMPIKVTYVKEETTAWDRYIKFEYNDKLYEVKLSWCDEYGYDIFFYVGSAAVLVAELSAAGLIREDDTLHGYLDELTFKWNTPVNTPSLLCIGKDCDKCNNT